MDDVVRMIYDGDYAPADRLADKPPELREARENAYQSYAAFKKALTDEQLEAYEKMMEVQGEVAGLELREAIEALRWDYPIVTNDDGTGYYIPTPDSRGRMQAAMWLARQGKRQESIKRATRGARLFVAQRQEG